MRIAYISDIHLEQEPEGVHPRVDSLLRRDGSIIDALGFPKQIGADVLVIAGDIHHDAVIRALLVNELEKRLNLPVLTIAGNHDCHFNTVGHLYQRPALYVIGGVSFGLATLWTHLSPLDQIKAPSFVDMQEITGMTPVLWNDLHRNHLDLLIGWAPDVIVTHHAPFEQSISDGYHGHPMNAFFVNTKISPDDFPNTKVWIHGHVHQDHDYTLSNIRVVCNPKGYWFEKRATKIEIVEV